MQQVPHSMQVVHHNSRRILQMQHQKLVTLHFTQSLNFKINTLYTIKGKTIYFLHSYGYAMVSWGVAPLQIISSFFLKPQAFLPVSVSVDSA